MKQQLLKNQYLNHISAFERYNTWEAENFISTDLDAEEAIAALGTLFDFLPEKSRTRPIETSGITIMRTALSKLKQSNEYS